MVQPETVTAIPVPTSEEAKEAEAAVASKVTVSEFNTPTRVGVPEMVAEADPS